MKNDFVENRDGDIESFEREALARHRSSQDELWMIVALRLEALFDAEPMLVEIEQYLGECRHGGSELLIGIEGAGPVSGSDAISAMECPVSPALGDYDLSRAIQDYRRGEIGVFNGRWSEPIFYRAIKVRVGDMGKAWIWDMRKRADVIVEFWEKHCGPTRGPEEMQEFKAIRGSAVEILRQWGRGALAARVEASRLSAETGQGLEASGKRPPRV